MSLEILLGFLGKIVKPILEFVSRATAAIFLYKSGQKNQKLHQAEEELDRVRKANEARVRLESDPDYARKLRKKYTRK